LSFDVINNGIFYIFNGALDSAAEFLQGKNNNVDRKNKSDRGRE
jgi:hypothetical protein